MVNFEFHIRFVSFKICCLSHVENYKFHHGLKLVSKSTCIFKYDYSITLQLKIDKRVFCLQFITTQYFHNPPPPCLTSPLPFPHPLFFHTLDAEAFGTRSLDENLAQLRGFRLGRKEILDEEEEDLLSLLEPDLVRPELREAGFVSEAAASSLFFRPRERFGAFFLFRTSLSFLKETNSIRK